MAKPICVVRVDNRNVDSSGVSEMFHIQKALDDKLTDYHVLCVPFEQSYDDNLEPIQIQVFHEKDFTEIQYQELKQMIEDSLKK